MCESGVLAGLREEHTCLDPPSYLYFFSFPFPTSCLRHFNQIERQNTFDIRPTDLSPLRIEAFLLTSGDLRLLLLQLPLLLLLELFTCPLKLFEG